jgi:hypothetical protein
MNSLKFLIKIKLKDHFNEQESIKKFAPLSKRISLVIKKEEGAKRRLGKTVRVKLEERAYEM